MEARMRKFSATASRSFAAPIQNNGGCAEQLFLRYLANTCTNTFCFKSYLIISLLCKIFNDFHRAILSGAPCTCYNDIFYRVIQK